MNKSINQSINILKICFKKKKEELKRALKIRPGPCFPSRILDTFINKKQMGRGPELLKVSSLKQAQVSKESMPFFSKITLFGFCFLRFFFNVGIFKVFIEFVAVLLLCYVLAFRLQSMWDLSLLTSDRTCTPCIGSCCCCCCC